MTRFLITLTAALLALVAAGRSAGATTYTHTFCFKLQTGHVDAATGDYGTTSPWIARGIKFTAYGQTLYASETTGCKTLTASSGGLTTVAIYAESQIGASHNITIRSFTDAAALATWQDNPVDGNQPHWVLMVLPACTGTTCTATVTNTASQTDVVSNLHAAAVWTVHHVDALTSPRLSGTRELFAHQGGCGATNSSCQAGDTIKIQSAWSGARRKFVVAHEAGHWLHSQWAGGPLGASYAVNNPPGTACDSTGIPGEHALRSLEYQSAAFLEGFAHFLATVAYNDTDQTDGEFHYYKSTGPYAFDVVDVEHGPDGGDDNWYVHGCNCPGSCSFMQGGTPVAADELGTELDWLRAYWDFLTNATPGTRPSMADIFAHVAATYAAYPDHYGLTDTHNRLVSHLAAGFTARWDEAMDYNGADPTPE